MPRPGPNGAASLGLITAGFVGETRSTVQYNLWKPYQAISEVWFASEMHNPNRVVDKPAVFPLWWTTWIFGSLLSRGSARYAEDAGDNIDKLITATHMSIADDLVWLLAAVFCILVVRSISGAQERGWRRRGSG